MNHCFSNPLGELAGYSTTAHNDSFAMGAAPRSVVSKSLVTVENQSPHSLAGRERYVNFLVP